MIRDRLATDFLRPKCRFRFDQIILQKVYDHHVRNRMMEYLANEEKYLPMVQYWKQQTKENPAPKGDLGWNAGVINGNRPYYYICWATEGVTTLSIYMTTKGMENATDEELDKLMQENGIYRRKIQEEHKAQIDRFPSGENEFFLITQTVGVEDETYITSDCAAIFSFEALYEFNKERVGRS